MTEEERISQMFNGISSKYDQINRILSLGIDLRWRKKMLAYLPKGDNLHLLDLATGTCDQILMFMKSKKIEKALGIDLAEDMLAVGKEKIKNLSNVELKCANALHIPEEKETFDVVTISFGIRNVDSPLQCLKEMHRVVKKNGRALILEFSLPENGFIRRAHVFYLRTLLPKLGGFLSGKKEAYSYLNKTIETFPFGEDFISLMHEAGFTRVQSHPMTFGIATLYIGDVGEK